MTWFSRRINMRHKMKNTLNFLSFFGFLGLMLTTYVPLIAEQPVFEPFVSKIVRPGKKAEKISVPINGAKEIFLVADYEGDSYDSDQAIWADPVLIRKDGSRLDLTTVKPKETVLGWGTLYLDKNHQGKPLSIAGTNFKKGFWAHAPSMLRFELEGDFETFEAQIGLDSGSERGSVVFMVRDKPVEMPTREEYTKNFGLAPASPPVPPIAESEIEFNPEAAKRLLDNGIEELVFIRRATFNGNHIYTEYVNSTWMPGGGLCVLDLKSGKVREIAPEFTKNGVIGWFDVSFDARKIVFDFKKAPLEGYRIYEIDIDGDNLKQLTFPPENEAELVKKFQRDRGYHHGTDDMDPCYLPDGGIVFVSTRCQFSVLCDSSDNFTVRNIYRMNADGSGMLALSYSALSEATPVLMADGRILYHRWEYVDKSAGNAKSLWAMNPDGTGSAEVYGNSISFPETMIQARPVPGSENKIVMLGASHCCPNNALGTVILVDKNKDIRSLEAMRYITDDVAAFHHNGFHFKNDAGEWVHDMTGVPGRLFRNPYPVSEKLYIVSHKPKGLAWSQPNGYDLSLLDENGKDMPLLRDDSVSCWQPYPLKAREKLPVPKSIIDSQLAEDGLARCVVTDIYTGMENVERGEVKFIRILEQIPRPWEARKPYGDDHAGTTHAHSAVGNGSLSVKVQHGIVPVDEDGSAHFLVPAGKAIYFQALDENCNAIQTERTYVNYMPGEVRSCIGCHETPNSIPDSTVNRVPKALMRSASVPMPQPGQKESRLVFDYDRQIQPILDRNCIECHGKGNDSPDLRGTHSETYSVSYRNLLQLGNAKDKQLLGYRFHRDEDAAMNGIEYIRPNRTGALSSPLAAWLSGREKIEGEFPELQKYLDYLRKSHPDLKITKDELLVVSNWLDLNCLYHCSYWGRLHEKFRDHPNYRPEIPFEDVRLRTVPEIVTRTESP